MLTPCDTILTAACVLTQNDRREIIEDGGIAVTGGRIAAVGKAADVKAGYAAGRVIDLPGAMVMPGLINAHTHASMSLFRGLADDLPLMDWLQEHIWPVERQLSPELVHAGALLSCAEMLRLGTTCFCDMYLYEREVARAADEAGLRAVLGEGVFNQPTPSYERPDEVWGLIEELRDAYAGHPRIRTAVMCHAVYTTTPELLWRAYDLAEAYDCQWMIHLAETPAETRQCLEMFGERPVAYADRHGLLSPRTVLAHGVDLIPGELDVLAARGAMIAHCPESNMKLASGVAPVQAALSRSITLGLGTDGAASNNDLNMFQEMTTAALLQKVHLNDPTALAAGDVLDMATRGGAALLAWPELGSLAPGQAADLVALDLSAPNLQPLYNPVSQVVYAANGGEAMLTMVAGKVVYEAGSFTAFDYPGLLREMRDIRRWVLSKRGT